MPAQGIALLFISFIITLPFWSWQSVETVALRYVQDAGISVAAVREGVSTSTAPRAVSESPSVPRATDAQSFNQFPVSPERGEPRLIAPAIFQKELTAGSALAVDVRTHAVLYAKSAEEKRPIGSITKLLTALVALDAQPTLDARITVAPEDMAEGPQLIYPGETITVNDALHIGLIASSNSAMRVLARATGLSAEAFKEKMNKKAEALGMHASHFEEPTGLNSGNYSTVNDVAILLEAALDNATVQRIASMPVYRFKAEPSGRVRAAYSTDQLLGASRRMHTGVSRIVGAKTGFIEEAGYCFAMEAEGENKERVIVVVLGSRDQLSRFSEAENLANWVFQSYVWPKPATAFGG